MSGLGRRWSGLGFVLLLLVILEAVARLGLVRAMFLPPVSTILGALWSITTSFELFREYAATLWRASAGFGIAAVLGILTGVLMGYFRPVYALLEPLIEMLRPIPTVAIIPVSILLLGIDDAMKIFVIAWACFFPIWLNALEGVLSVERGLLDTARTFRLSDQATLIKIVLPFAMPRIFTGMRISVAFALILAVVAEMVAGEVGIGSYIMGAEAAFRVPQMYAAIFSLAIVGYTINRMFLLLEGHLLRWRASTQPDLGA